MKPKVRVTPIGVLATEAALRQQAEAEAAAILREASKQQKERQKAAAQATHKLNMPVHRCLRAS